MVNYKDQELFGWIGGFIFIIAQLSQIIHTFNIKETKDISFILQLLLLTGNTMYACFGYFDKSQSLFIVNIVLLILIFIQMCQKIYYGNYYRPGIIYHRI